MVFGPSQVHICGGLQHLWASQSRMSINAETSRKRRPALRLNFYGGGGVASVEPGQSLVFRYRVILHDGDEKVAHISNAFATYAKQQFDEK